MTNFIEIGSHKAVISYVPEYKMFRGKFLNTTGYFDFLADSVDGIYRESEISLQAYLQDCQELGIEAFKSSKPVEAHL